MDRKWLVGALAILPAVLLALAVRALILVPIFHVREAFWSTAFVVLACYELSVAVISVCVRALSVRHQDWTNPVVLSQAFHVPADVASRLIERAKQRAEH